MTNPEVGEGLPAIRTVPFAGNAASNLTELEGGVLLLGWSIIETSGVSPVTLNIVNGGDNNGEVIAPISLTAGQSTRDLVPNPGLLIDKALTVVIVAGAARGSLWVRDL